MSSTEQEKFVRMDNDLTDHLDSSPSEAVRRHAATFRSVRERHAAEDAAREARASGEGDGALGEGAWAVGSDGDGLRVLGARAAAKFAEEATTAGWRVVVRIGRARRERDGAWFDSAVVAVERGAAQWCLGHWRADPIRPPIKRKWKFVGALASDGERGTRSVGARELTAAVQDQLSDDLSDQIR